MRRLPQKRSAAGASAGPAFRPDRAPGGKSEHRQAVVLVKRCAPTFALLREKRRLTVRNPENGARFTISLRDWQSMLWAVRVHPERKWRQPGNAYTTAHRILPRTRIEDWLAELRLA